MAIYINGTKVLGGSGGSIVSVTQVVSSGTNIADIVVDGVATHLYAQGYTEVTGTLTAGETSITLSDASITTSSTFELFNDLDVPYNSKSVSTGSITYTFDAQQTDMVVKVRVS